MAIKIQVEKPVIPIELGKLKFEFDITDENIERFKEGADKVQKEFESIVGDDLDASKAALKKGFDYILGEGTFDKIYDMSPSVVIVMNYFKAVTEGIGNELDKRTGNTAQQKAQKYIKSKKK